MVLGVFNNQSKAYAGKYERNIIVVFYDIKTPNSWSVHFGDSLGLIGYSGFVIGHVFKLKLPWKEYIIPNAKIYFLKIMSVHSLPLPLVTPKWSFEHHSA